MTFHEDYPEFENYLPQGFIKRNYNKKIFELYNEFLELYTKKDEHERYRLFSFIFFYGLLIELLRLEFKKLQTCNENQRKLKDLNCFIQKKLKDLENLRNLKDFEVFKLFNFYNLDLSDIENFTRKKRNKILHFENTNISEKDFSLAITKTISYLDSFSRIKKKILIKKLDYEYLLELLNLIFNLKTLSNSERNTLFTNHSKNERDEIFMFSKHDFYIICEHIFENRIEENYEILDFIAINFDFEEFRVIRNAEVNLYYNEKISLYDFKDIIMQDEDLREIRTEQQDGIIYGYGWDEYTNQNWIPNLKKEVIETIQRNYPCELYEENIRIFDEDGVEIEE